MFTYDRGLGGFILGQARHRSDQFKIDWITSDSTALKKEFVIHKSCQFIII